MTRVIKVWTPIIASLLAFIGMIVVAMIQTSGATKTDINTIVKVMNEQVIPAIQKTVDSNDAKLDKEILERLDELAKLKERLAWLEGKFGAMRGMTTADKASESVIKFLSATTLPKPKSKEDLPKLQEMK